MNDLPSRRTGAALLCLSGRVSHAGRHTQVRGLPGRSLALCGSSGICRNVSAPLQAIVVLGQGKENHISRMSGKAAVKALLSQMYVRRREAESVIQAMALATEVAARIPVFQLSCLPDISAVECLEQAIKEE